MINCKKPGQTTRRAGKFAIVIQNALSLGIFPKINGVSCQELQKENSQKSAGKAREA